MRLCLLHWFIYQLQMNTVHHIFDTRIDLNTNAVPTHTLSQVGSNPAFGTNLTYTLIMTMLMRSLFRHIAKVKLTSMF